MDTNQQEEGKELLEKEYNAKNYLIVSFMFGVFFLAALKDLISAGFSSASVIIRLALIVGLILLAVYFYFQANGMLDDEEEDKLDEYRESLEKDQAEEGEKETFIDKYLNKPDLKSFKKTIYTLCAIIFVIFMALAVLSFGGEPAEEPTDGTTTTDTTTTPATTTR